MEGKRIGRYELRGELGRGGFGRVFRAYDPAVNRMVAVKTLTTSGEADLLKRFRNEAAAAGRLRHQNIVIIYDFGEHEGTPYLVMELLEGENLDRIISHERPLTLLQRLDIMLQTAAGLHHAHAAGIVHRDIKPANIMLQPDGLVKVLDFGVALVTQATASRLTPQGSLIGTFAYMSPEQFHGDSPGITSDIFAYGLTFYKLFTGRHPFEAPCIAELMRNIVTRPLVPLRQLNPECPVALEQAVARMLAKSPADRYQSLDEVRFDLAPVMRDLQKASAAALLDEANSLCSAGKLEEAQGPLQRALELDAGNAEARALRERVQKLVRQRAIRPQIAALVSAAGQYQASRKFAEALKALESAIQLDDSDAELQNLRAAAAKALARSRHADQLVAQARTVLERNHFSEAAQNLEEAIALDPQHPVAAGLLATVRKKILAHERFKHLRQQLKAANEANLRHDHAAAIELLEPLKHEYPDESEIPALLEQSQKLLACQLRDKRVQETLERAEELFHNRDFEHTAEFLSPRVSEFPDAANLRVLLAKAEEELNRQKRAESLSRLISDVHRLDSAGSYDEAITRLKSATALFPEENSLRDLLQTVRFNRAQSETQNAERKFIAQVQELIAAGSFEAALQQIDTFTSRQGAFPEADSLRLQAREGLRMQRQQAARKLRSDARQLLEQKNTSDACRLLEQGAQQYPDDPEVKQLLAIAHQRLRQERQAALADTSSEATTVAEQLPKPPAVSSHRRSLLIAAAATAAVSISVGGLILGSRKSASPTAEHSVLSKPAQQTHVAVPPPPSVVPAPPPKTLPSPATPDAAAAKIITHPPPAPQPQAPPAPTAEQRWQTLQTSTDIAQLDAFARAHATAPQASLARERVQKLTWDAVDKSNPSALQDFIARFPNFPPAEQALAKAEQNRVLQTLDAFARAVQQKDAALIKQQWPNISGSDLDRWSEKFSNAQSITFDLKPATPQITGSSARVQCRGTIREHYPGDVRLYSNERTMHFELRKVGDEWKIASMR